jgi:AcrR family transcriptional regulator
MMANRLMKPDAPQRREEILAAALELFARQGFAATRVPDIAQRAGVGAGTIYRYFASKEALFNALYQMWKERFYAALTEGYPTDAPARERFGFLWSRLAAFAQEHPVAFAFLEMHHHQPYLDKASAAVTDRLADFLKAFLAECERNQITKPLPADALIAIVFGSFVGLFKAALLGQIDLTPDLLAQAERCCWEAIRR